MKYRQLTFNRSFRTDIGKLRKENQDSYAVAGTSNWSLLIVCDGMGGTKGGSLASALAVEVLLKQLSPESRVPVISSVTAAIAEANAVLYAYGKQHEEFDEMGTTALVFFCSRASCFVCHVGDTRLYRMRAGVLEQITKDHTWVQELVDSGALEAVHAEKSPVSHLLTRALGTREEVEVESQELDLPREGDFYFLCTDGLYGLVPHDLLHEMVRTITPGSLDDTVDTLMNAALEAGGKDNITIAAVVVDGAPEKSHARDVATQNFTLDVSDPSGIDLAALLNSMHQATPIDDSEHLIDIADEVSREISPELLSKRSASDASPFISVFIFGIFLSVVFMLYVSVGKEDPPALVREIEPVEESHVDDRIQERAKKIRAVIEDRRKAEMTSVFLVPPSPFSKMEYVESYLNDVTANFYKVPPRVPAITLPRPRKVLQEERPVRPIVWENEAELLRRFREERRTPRKNTTDTALEKTDTDSPDSRPETVLSYEETISLIEDKEILRSRIFDVDEKIRHLGIRSTEERDERVEALHVKESILQDEILEIIQENDRLKRQAAHLRNFLDEAELGNLIQIGERIVTFEETLQAPLQEIKKLDQDIRKTKKMLESTQDEIILANRLSTLLRNRESAEHKFRAMLTQSLETRISATQTHRSLLKYLLHLLRIQRNGVLRAIGYLNAHTSPGEERAREFLRNLTEERNSLYSELVGLQKILPDSDEIRHSRSMYEKVVTLEHS
jgi:PPM family protein phosphatase